MSDLIKRLRDAYQNTIAQHEAADELERKDAAIAELVGLCRNVVERGIGARDVRAMKEAIAKHEPKQEGK